MKSSPSLLTPFVRSDAVGAILAETLGWPDREVTLSDLSRATGVSLPVVHKEVGRLVDAEVLLDRVEGRNRLVRANRDHPLFASMRTIIEATYGPLPVIREHFADLPGAQSVVIFGSWAARRAGQPGPPPHDLDVLVVGDVRRKEAAERAGRAGKILGLPVNVTRLSQAEWDANEPSPFVRTVRSRPYIDVRSGELDG